MKKRRCLVEGVGINDADYVLHTLDSDGKFHMCPFYVRWKHVLHRCYSENLLKKYPTYIGCYVSEDWKTFSKFKSWMQKQPWQGNDLDKDILIFDNKLYSEETCVFVPEYLNKFLINRDKKVSASSMLGVTKYSYKGVFKDYISRVNSFDGVSFQTLYLGRFKTELDAHREWQKGKIEAIKIVLDLYRKEDCFDTRVENSFLERVSKLEQEIDLGVETLSI